mmetsp:Transcript_87711/g.183374  ORF Transcript_87711/g.183374 Transcript_87711/m.183374 type:complete len:102 (-) Transcript_87711:322-627(-)|eukprot:CAMPEP_0206470270 /NCGR_PEP_ID=MMETSP0324_2-20121206/30826_1 /ASSEMBLY_ACC=CAM_ASM_000836 /TAXON_ID=2866 /ORGANISM="Crypthecodinium cohnii, Strain Seligo" /LENGTH=101 /DNA_ID=CAMNT_0053944289 /DNA_START=157 /DNA_END=462 /DNA_ORIENTATION=+
MAIAASVCSAERGKVAGLTLVSCRVDKAMMNGGGTKNSEQGARDKGQGKDMGLVGPQTSPAVCLGRSDDRSAQTQRRRPSRRPHYRDPGWRPVATAINGMT